MMYVVHATVTVVTRNGYVGTRALPTFYLDSRVQGITSSEGAEDVARAIVTPFLRPEESACIAAYPVVLQEAS